MSVKPKATSTKRTKDDILAAANGTCEHIGKMAGTDIFKKWYQAMCQRLVFPITDKHARVRAQLLQCPLCPLNGKLRHAAWMVSCVQCGASACETHIETHFNFAGHGFGMNAMEGHIYCHTCEQYVYDRRVEKWRFDILNCYRENLQLLKKEQTWIPTSRDAVTWKHCNIIRKPVEIRGIHNLGNTCYMNCILQILAHTPLLREYILTEQHDCDMGHDTCFMCAFCTVVQECNQEMPGTSEGLTAIAPTWMLHSLWDEARRKGKTRALDHYGQQDAHEFFIAAFELLHQAMSGEDSPASTDSCLCLIHKGFTGRMVSNIVCKKCNAVSSITQPFLEVPLSLNQAGGSEIGPDMHIDTTIENFTRPEDVERACEKCGNCEAVKRTTFKILPTILVFHLKRFDQTTGKPIKISTFVDFTLKLRMSPYIERFHDHPDMRESLNAETSRAQLNIDNHNYFLYGVVSHRGNMEGGHYVNYVLSRDNIWYLCDDVIVKRVKPEDVLRCEAYLLFYQLNTNPPIN